MIIFLYQIHVYTSYIFISLPATRVQFRRVTRLSGLNIPDLNDFKNSIPAVLAEISRTFFTTCNTVMHGLGNVVYQQNTCSNFIIRKIALLESSSQSCIRSSQS